MTEILVLLGLLSVATLAARRGYVGFVAHFFTTSLLVGVGVIIAALGLLTSTTTDGLDPALRVGAAWLALLLGLRGVRPKLAADYIRLSIGTFFLGSLTWAVLAGVMFAALRFAESAGLGFTGTSRQLPILGAALLLGGVSAATGLSTAAEGSQQTRVDPRATERLLFLARHDDGFGALALCAAIWLWPLDAAGAPAYEIPLAAAGVVIGLGVWLALSQLLNHGVTLKTPAPAFIALIGLVVFAAGVGINTHLPIAPVAFFLGATLGLFGVGQLLLDKGLTQTEHPVRIALLALVGLNLEFELGAIIVGVVLAVARIGVKVAVRQMLSVSTEGKIPLAHVIGFTTTAIAFALSFALSRDTTLLGDDVLLTICVAASVTDLLTFALWRRPAEEKLTEASS